MRARRGWGWPSLFAGAAAGAATLPFVGLLHGMAGAVSSGPQALALVPFFGLVATGVGLPMILLIGVPAAALVWTLLRPIRAQWIHVVAFAVLGGVLVLAPAAVVVVASAAPMAASVWTAGFGWHSLLWMVEDLVWHLQFAVYGVVAAGVARLVAGLVVRRTLRSHAQWAALAAFPDVAARWRA